MRSANKASQHRLQARCPHFLEKLVPEGATNSLQRVQCVPFFTSPGEDPVGNRLSPSSAPIGTCLVCWGLRSGTQLRFFSTVAV
ncbi:MAG: hypothetical protein Q8P67_28930 [archaeon]|nr:hypothetical protein [archaeon]